jgi:transposase
MPKRIIIEPHLTLEELETRYRRAKDSVERSHYQIIWLLAQGRPSEEVASITGYSRSWIYELVWGYNRVGPETLGDKRHDLPGAEPLLNEEQQNLLHEAVQSPPKEGGRWNGTKVANWMSQQLGRPINRQRGWEYLKLIRYRMQAPPAKQDFSSKSKRPMAQSDRRATGSRLRRVNTVDTLEESKNGSSC